MERTAKGQIKVGAGVIIIKDGKTLLAQRKSHKALGGRQWGSAGGHVELGETPAQAAVREAREELGIEVGNLRFLICLDEQWNGDNHYVDFIFLADIISGDPKPMELEAVEAVGWFPLDDLPTPLFAPVQMALKAIKSGKHYEEFKE